MHADGFGSTRFLSDTSTAITDTWSFDAFGNAIERSGSTLTTHLYRGEEFDHSLGWYQLRARYYDPSSGRFSTLDLHSGSAAIPQSLHKYLYANSDPINNLDPTGRFTIQDFQIAIEIVTRAMTSASARAAAYYLGTARSLSVAIGGLGYLSTRGQAVLGELQATGYAGVQALQMAFTRFQPAVTRAQAMMAPNWRTFQQLKDTMNGVLSGARFNPTMVQWHHIVGQSVANVQRFGANAINSLANVVPISTRVHGVITRFYNTGITVNGQAYSRFQDYIVTKNWEQQAEIGLGKV